MVRACYVLSIMICGKSTTLTDMLMNCSLSSLIFTEKRTES